MIRRTCLIALELVAGFLGVVAIALAILFWRLSSGPISLAFATPYIEQALSVEQPRIDVEIQETELIWAGWDRAFNIRVTNAAALGPGGKVLAFLPDVSIGFSTAAMMRGLIAPQRLEIHGLNAAVERREDGAIVLGFYAGNNEAADQEFLRELPRYLSQLTAPSDPESAFGYLQSIRVTDVDLQFFDRPRNAIWRAPDTDIEILREGDKLDIVAAMALAFDDRSTHLTAHMEIGRNRPTVDMAFDVRGLVPSDFARRFPELSRFAALDHPVSGQFRLLAQQTGEINSVTFDLSGAEGSATGSALVDAAGEYDATVQLTGVRAPAIASALPELARHVRLDAALDASLSGHFGVEGTPHRAEIELRSGPGTVELTGRMAAPVSFKGMRLKARIEDRLATAQISEAEIDFGGPKVTLEASAHRIGESYRASVDAKLHNLPMSGLENYWPAEFGEPARSWTTTNIRSGVIEEGTIALVFQVPSGALAEVSTVSVSGGLRYRDLEVGYFGDLPKVTDIRGTASFTYDRFSLTVTSGRLKDIVVDHGVIDMTRLDTDNEAISVDLVLRGPLATALAVADSEPLNFVSDVGIDPSTAGGTLAMRLGLRFPLRSDVRLDQVAVVSTADLRGVRIAPGPFGFDLDDGNLELKLSRGAMRVGGNVRLNGVPLSVDWHEEFNRQTTLRSRYIVSGRLTQEAVGRLGLPASGFINGPSEVNVIVTRFDDGRSEILAGGNLQEAVVAIPQLGWRKPAGQPCSISLGMRLDPDGRPSVDRLQVDGDRLSLDADVSFDGSDLKLWHATIRRLKVGQTDVRGRLRSAGDGYAVSLEGNRLDLEPIVAGGNLEAREVPAEEGGLPPLEVDANLAELHVGQDGLFRDVKAVARYDGETWQSFEIEAGLGNGKTFRTRYAPDDKGGYLLDVTSDDAGAALRSIGWSEKMEGGLLTVSARRPSPAAPLVGVYKLTNYKLTQAPILARLLQVASLTGIFDALGQRGLDFVTFDGSFTYDDRRLYIDKARTFGSSIGITVEGSLDIAEDTVDLNGTVVPAYTVNRVLGQIPILGRLLTGGENEGVFAANYAVTGPIEDPVVAVNPLSALAPGFLRKLFDVFGRSEGERPRPEPVPAPPAPVRP